jgi:hypothetical protein
MTQTYTNERTFTVTNAKYIASKVAADLKRMQRFYSLPSDIHIQSYESELIEFLRYGFLDTVTYGFQKNGNWIEPTLIYRAKDLYGLTSNDDDPGSVRPGADISGATFGSFLTYSTLWMNKSENEKESFSKNLPFQRGIASEPGVSGYLISDRTYSSADRALNRSSVKSY